MAFKITTTGTPASVVFNDLGARTFVHPIVDYNLEQEYSAAEIAASADVAAAITGGEITAKDANNNPITDSQNNFVPLSSKGQIDGVASLDAGGKIPAPQIPAVALPEVSVVADATARLALTVQEGDEAIQLDDGSHWIYDGTAWFERPSGGGSDLEVKEEGSQIVPIATIMDFISKLVTVTSPVAGTVEVVVKATPLVYSKLGNSGDAIYKIMGRVIWPGSDVVGVPASITGNIYVETSSVFGDVRIFDATNSQQIALITGANVTDLDNLEDLGALANISTGEALWEIQGKTTDGSGNKVKIDSMNVNF